MAKDRLDRRSREGAGLFLFTGAEINVSILSWVAAIFIVAGNVFLSIDMLIASKACILIGCLVWTLVGLVLRNYALAFVNVFSSVILTLGMFL